LSIPTSATVQEFVNILSTQFPTIFRNAQQSQFMIFANHAQFENGTQLDFNKSMTGLGKSDSALVVLHFISKRLLYNPTENSVQTLHRSHRSNLELK
jgi:hypothetical protein